MQESENNLPTIDELTSDIELAYKNDQFNLLLNQEPPEKWIKTHPFIKGHKYIPIDKVEYLLKRIFKVYRIEITGQGTSFNGVYVTVRVHYLNPINAQIEWHDGIGACQLQTKKDTSPSDLANINNGAISMAFPIAKTLAIKDACDHFGKLFGSDLNRKDTIPYKTDPNLRTIQYDELKELYELKQDAISEDDKVFIERILNEKETKSYRKLWNKLKRL